jgi:hypothetical protein
MPKEQLLLFTEEELNMELDMNDKEKSKKKGGNPVAKYLVNSGKYSPRVVRNRKKYTRKTKHKTGSLKDQELQKD